MGHDSDKKDLPNPLANQTLLVQTPHAQRLAAMVDFGTESSARASEMTERLRRISRSIEDMQNRIDRLLTYF